MLRGIPVHSTVNSEFYYGLSAFGRSQFLSTEGIMVKPIC